VTKGYVTREIDGKQDRTGQDSTAQHSTAQHSTAQDNISSDFECQIK
jgi:hypothetical protein